MQFHSPTLDIFFRNSEIAKLNAKTANSTLKINMEFKSRKTEIVTSCKII